MTRFKNFIRNHEVATFFLLAYAITWSVWTPISYGYVYRSLELSPPIVLLYIAGSFGPFLSAVLVTALCGGSLRALFSQLLKWRVSVKWWLAAFFMPVILYSIMAGIHILLGGQLNWSEVSLLALPGGFLTVFLWGGGNEELGWRGFALPRLQEKYRPFIASLGIGVVWTLWHAPVGIIELGFVDWAKDLPFYMMNVTGISFVATWLYNKTGGSVLLAMVFHASVNSSQSLYPIENMFSKTGEFARTGAWIIIIMALLMIPGLGFFKVPAAISHSMSNSIASDNENQTEKDETY
jgi:membrane protease YdiL (CAAX protease family)